ncbi:MAG: hypothetical protein WBF42_13535 [Terracidiphilus sp.]
MAEYFVVREIKLDLDDRPGGKMKQEVYRFAFDEANTELSQILGEFEQLRARKDRIEKVVEALKPLAGIEASAAAAGQKSADSPSYSY